MTRNAFSPYANTANESRSRHVDRRGAAALVESIALLFLLICATVVIVSAFGRAALTSERASRLARATDLATICAEEFSAHPDTTPKTLIDGELSATCEIASRNTDAGTLWIADIVVLDDAGNEVYSLRTSRYQSREEM